MSVFQICGFLSGATEVWNTVQDVPYAYKGTQWVGYDNMKSFQIKVRNTRLSVQLEIVCGLDERLVS